jgi:carbamoyltransferase
LITLGYNGFSDSADMFARLYRRSGIDRHRVLGHDAAAALFVDGELVAAVEEERLNREKKTADFPEQALRWCLAEAGITFEDVDRFAFPWAFTEEVTDRQLRAAAESDKSVTVRFDDLRRLGELYGRLVSKDAILADFHRRTGFELPADRLVLVPHHHAHLMCGYHLSGWNDAAFLVSDGRAELLSSVAGEIRDGRITIFDDMCVDIRNSLAMLYSKVTRYLGFVPNNDEYKVMGLSAYAVRPTGNPLLEQVIRLHEGGRYSLNFANETLDQQTYYEMFDRIFDRAAATDEREFQAKVAWMVQQAVEVVTAHQLRHLAARTRLPRLLLEGGLALNCVNNSKLLESSAFTDIEVGFGASDVGVAIGAGAAAAGSEPGRGRTSPYLGPSYSHTEILDAVRAVGDRVEWTVLGADEVVAETTKLLRDKVVVGWFQGRVEYGPRALGHRSILANPSFPDIKDIINERVKHREPFRPFAPVVRDTRAADVFEMGKKTSSPYMTFVFGVREHMRERVVGACHVDGTARVQTVSDQDDPLLAELLDVFEAQTGIPCLINTSFNIAGEPIVCSPADALRTFLDTEIDYLVLGCVLVAKRPEGSVPDVA